MQLLFNSITTHLSGYRTFPHKIGEYLASGNPVISTNYGEVKYYFTDMKNMLIAESYNIDEYATKMQFVIDNPALVKKIGIEGKIQPYQFLIIAVKLWKLIIFYVTMIRDQIMNIN